MSDRKKPAYSVLDLASRKDTDEGPALQRSLALAQHVERLGFTRFWVAEHHNMDAIVSSATAVLIGYLAGGTDRIRVGAGGVMLPNHAPLVIAEQFGTLESLYPGRIDLGLGRAPGTDPLTARALRNHRSGRCTDREPNRCFVGRMGSGCCSGRRVHRAAESMAVDCEPAGCVLFH